MLVLSRKKNETVEVHGPDGSVIARIMIVDIRGDKVRLGIEAPREYGIHRKEVAEEIRRDKLEQSQA